MSKVLVNESSLSSIGNAIREKNGETTKYKPSEMGQAISSLSVGGGDTIPEEAFTDGHPDNSYRFYNNTWNWFILEYKDRLHGMELAPHMFDGANQLTTVPTLEVYGSANHAFYRCQNLESVNIHFPNDLPAYDDKSYKWSNFECMFQNCQRLRTINIDMFEGGTDNAGSESRIAMFENCYSLRQLPNLNPINNYAGRNANLYLYLAHNCYVLDEIINLPVCLGYFSATQFQQTVNQCYRLQDFTFATTNGMAQTANWHNQTIDLSYYVGWNNGDANNITGYNSGIVGCRIDDDADYSTLKNNPDSWTNDYRYSRYNKTSAVRTINSLPDTSACLATYGGTNTIKFKADAGKFTDGGAINTLNDAEIAVATAKGWTVSFV